MTPDTTDALTPEQRARLELTAISTAIGHATRIGGLRQERKDVEPAAVDLEGRSLAMLARAYPLLYATIAESMHTIRCRHAVSDEWADGDRRDATESERRAAHEIVALGTTAATMLTHHEARLAGEAHEVAESAGIAHGWLDAHHPGVLDAIRRTVAAILDHHDAHAPARACD